MTDKATEWCRGVKTRTPGKSTTATETSGTEGWLTTARAAEARSVQNSARCACASMGSPARRCPRWGLHGVPRFEGTNCGIRVLLAPRPSRFRQCQIGSGGALANIDRKSTRLNSSHITISYAVFCLKKKRNKKKDAVA